MISELDSTVLGDLQIIDDAWSDDEISNDKIRNVSTCLRRLLIENTLGQCARNRNIDLLIESLDIKWILKNIEKSDVVFLENVGAKCFGVEISIVAQENGPKKLFSYTPEGWNPEATVSLKIDNFLSQKILYFCGDFVQRREIIKYVCNKAGGVHYDSKRDSESSAILDKIRNAVLISAKDNMPILTLNLDNPQSLSRDFVFRKNHIDPVFLAVYGVCNFLTGSESIRLLRQDIQNTIA